MRVKRLFDILASAVALVLFLPIFIALAILVLFLIGSPIFFEQVRPGLNSVPFKMLKFRTMKNSKGADGEFLPDADRLTRFGAILRASSLDELPELWNVLKGDMSIVGPRPLLLEYLDYYTDEEKIRHSVRPGITGLAQVMGRNLISWNDRLLYDVEYVNSQSFGLDMKIIFITIFQVIKREGVVVIPSSRHWKLSHERCGLVASPKSKCDE
jgi:lipopolysaccharide/colanic/teichoic acid biosynthesis glycosyltransferase